MKKCLLMLSGIVMTAGMLLAQPLNDNCSGALPMNYANTEAEVVLVSGDTRGATRDEALLNLCSFTWTDDDVYFALTTPAVLPAQIVIRTYFGTEANDVAEATGMAFYLSCAPGTSPKYCVNSNVPEDSHLEIFTECLEPNTTYYVRVWSTGEGPDFSGTFRIGAYANAVNTDVVLWTEDFSNGLAGWTTFGTCGGNPDSNLNAVFHYITNGILDKGAYSSPECGVVGSNSWCNGAVGVDSDYDDNRGNEGAFGTGPCPTGTGSQYILVSPAIDHSDWNVAGLSVTWIQGLREFSSDYFVGHRTFANGVWSDWKNVQVNQEFVQNSTHFTANIQRVFLGGAQEGDSLQIRFVYNANYYYWGIDDIKLIQAEANNLRLDNQFVSMQIPVQGVVGQGIPWTPQVDFKNAGAVTQSNVTLNARVMNEGGMTIYNQSVNFGNLPADSSLVNDVSTIPIPFDIATAPGTYTITYTVTSDSTDFDPTDNTLTYQAFVDPDIFATDRGVTNSVVGAPGNWNDGVPHSFIFGNYYHTPAGALRKFKAGTFGLENLNELQGVEISFVLFEWTTGLADEICQATERTLLGFATYTPGANAGGADGDTIITLEFENLQTAGPIVLKDMTSYILAIQWDSPGDNGDLSVLTSDVYDYGQTIQQLGALGTPHFAGMLAVPDDGINDGIDINAVTYNDGGSAQSIVPIARMETALLVAVKDPLPDNNIVKLYPNPAQDLVTLELELERAFDRVDIQIVNLEGKVISEKTLYDVETETTTLDVSDLPAGSYLAHVQTEVGRRYLVFIVQR